eukprot:m.588573 g.588573  ORF g.588573 m.588573 type:complete len:233 (-) comp58000_c0_seq20:1285-1983(-)
MGGCASKPRQEKAGPAGKTGAAPAKPPTTNSKPRQEKTVPAAQRTGAAAAKPTTSNSKLHQEKAGAAAASTREVGTKAGEAAADSKFRVVVVGGGVGGGYAVQALAAVGLAAHTLLVSAEQVLPYERPALSKGFLSKESPARLPGFHTCVGSGGERMAPDWFSLNLFTSPLCLSISPSFFVCPCRMFLCVSYDTWTLVGGAGTPHRESRFGWTLEWKRSIRASGGFTFRLAR